MEKLTPEQEATLGHEEKFAAQALEGTTEGSRTWKSDKPPMEAEQHTSRSQWKIADLVERMATENPVDLIKDECARLCGKLEARGLQRVRMSVEFTDATQLTVMVSVGGRCPCGAEKLGVVEQWNVNLFDAGPHTFEARLTQIEMALLGALDAKI